MEALSPGIAADQVGVQHPGEGVHEENVKRTYDENTRPDEEYELANTVEVYRVERYYAVEERKFVKFD